MTIKIVDLCSEDLAEYIGGIAYYMRPIDGSCGFVLEGKIVDVHLTEELMLIVVLQTRRQGEQSFSLSVAHCKIIRKKDDDSNEADIIIVHGSQESGHALIVRFYLPERRYGSRRVLHYKGL